MSIPQRAGIRARHGRGPRAWTLRGYWWAVAVVACAAQLLMMALVTAGILVASTSSAGRDDLRSQQLLVANLRQGIAEQEVGIGAYAASGDPRLLAPYLQGGADVDAALGQLRRQADATPRAASMAMVASSAESWRRWAEGERTRVASSGGPVRDTTAEQEGERLLARFTAAVEGLQGELERAQRAAASNLARAWQFALASLWVGSFLVGAVLGGGMQMALARSVELSQGLAAAAREIARTGHVRIPHADRSDEIGQLAQALQAWQSAAAEREIVIQQAPIGICQLDRERNILTASPAFVRMLGIPLEQIRGRPFRSLLHPEDLEQHGAAIAGLTGGRLDRVAMEHRAVRADGSLLWCSSIGAALRGEDGLPEGFVAILEDISERKQQLERAAEIQRGLLPQSTPLLQGYDLAGACRPAQDVAGDFYDWTLSDDGGQLDLTVADVMGKGLGAGLVMATMRAVLRSAPPELGPAARVRLAAEFVPRGAEDDGLFVTLFQARLDLATGVLRYVDAGHGYGAVRRAGGELVHLTERSLPVGIWPEQEFQEGTVRLEPGDALIVYSDGLVETEERTGDLSEYAGDLEEAADAREMVWRLMRRLPGRLLDDVTVLAIRRAPQSPTRSSPGSQPAWPAAVAETPLTARTGPEELAGNLPDGSETPPSSQAEPAPLGDSGDPETAVVGARLFRFFPARTQRQAASVGTIVGVAMHLLLVGLVTAGILAGTITGGTADDLRGQQLLAASLRQDVLEQDVGIGGYASSGDPRLLVPYTRGRRDVDAALGRLRQQTAGTPRAEQVARIGSASGDWQRWAEALRVRVATSGGPVRDATAEQDGQRLLTRFTAAVEGLEAELNGAWRAAASDEARAWQFALASLWVGSVVVGALTAIGIRGSHSMGGALRTIANLADAAREIARSRHVRIPDADRSDEFGDLARALQAWQTASATREIMFQQAPLGIARLDREGRIIEANVALRAMLGYTERDLSGSEFWDLVHPEDRQTHEPVSRSLADGTLEHAQRESRCLRADGGHLWCSMIGAALRGEDGLPEGFVVILEDISERRQQLERAAEIQRGLLPQSTPLLQGYDLAGACRPAQDVAGDFYDWTLSDDGGQLDLTVADVMGKGLGSGLVMATVRAVLRSAPPELGPAARLRLAAEFLPRGAESDGLFVTLFHGRLDLATGVLTYVDAGHGYGVVRRAGGELVQLGERSLPVGILPGQEFVEGTVRLEPGDALIVYSDGLLGTGEHAGDLSGYRGDLEEAADAQEMVWRLMRHLPADLPDDVTVLALRCAPVPDPLIAASDRRIR